MLQESAQLRGKGEVTVTLEPVEGFFAKTIASNEELAVNLVENGEGEHSVQPVQHPLPPFTVPLEENLRVGVMALKKISLRLKLGADLGVIVDLAVEDDHQIAIDAHHRLSTPSKIDN